MCWNASRGTMYNPLTLPHVTPVLLCVPLFLFSCSLSSNIVIFYTSTYVEVNVEVCSCVSDRNKHAVCFYVLLYDLNNDN